MTESTNPISAAGELAGFPDEAFECPYCGQMLAPSCRVCVSCKLPIDPARIQRKREEAEAAAAAIEAKPELPRVRFNWSILLAVLGVFLFIAIVTSLLVGPADAPTAMQVMLFVCAGWVYWDARQKLVRHPLRWALGTLLVWIVFFPWYLERRRKLSAPCPFIESESSPFIRVILLLLFISFLIMIIALQMGWQPPK